MSFVARFREVAAREGERVAIEHGARRVTYGELDAHALAIAAMLRARDIGAEDVVAIRASDRVAIVIGMLGVWYAGAAFVVITSDVPPARAQIMERDARVRFTLDDDVLQNVRDLPRGTFVANARDVDLAYVVFTSGTTGTPKGVLVTHAGIVPMLDAQIRAFDLAPGARATWMLSPLFDASISDVGTALLSGATIVALESKNFSPRDLAARLEALEVTHADLPPSLLALLCDALPKTLRTIVIGGEACAEHVVARVASRVRLVNVYGPTEATVCTSMNVCVAGERHGARIGMPLPHVTYRVEDDELLIGGACLARGYANDEELTARRFVDREGERFYRTGDRVRQRDERELEIVGRVDRQVKIAGVRIEPEEIESRLRDDEDVIEAAVVVEHASLRAIVVLREGRGVANVRARLAQNVPRWLVPARFTSTNALPRNASGKIDYAALAREGSQIDTREVGDASNAELEIAEAFASALNRAAFGVEEDFIAEGGDSLAVLAACAAADARGVILSPETIATECTARRVAACRAVSGMRTEDLARDVESITRTLLTDPPKAGRHDELTNTTSSRGARSVFLTGATGTLGARLVRALVARGASVTCLVRARDDEAARDRVARMGGDLPRVRAVRGDVALEEFGLPHAQWAALAREHDAIVHAAADLRLTASYAALRDTNVLGACHAADFASTGATKTLHCISTLSVFASSDLARSGRTFDESMSLHSARIVSGGYAQSKWAAEIAVRGAHVTRLGLLLPAKKTGDMFGAFVCAARALGCLPEGDAWRFDVTDVDFAASAIAHFVTSGEAPRVRHVANAAPASMDDLAHAIEQAGVALERVSLAEFRARAVACRADVEGLPALRGLALASFRALDHHDAASRAFDLFEATKVDLGARETLGDLARVGISCPSAVSVLPSIVAEILR